MLIFIHHIVIWETWILFPTKQRPVSDKIRNRISTVWDKSLKLQTRHDCKPHLQRSKVFLKKFLLVQAFLLLAKSWLRVWSHSRLRIGILIDYDQQAKRAKKRCRPYTACHFFGHEHRTEMESSITSLASRTLFEVLGLGFETQILGVGLEAFKSSKMSCPRLKDSIIFCLVK